MSAARTERLAVLSLLVSGLIWGLMWMPLKYFAAQGLGGVALTLVTYGVVGLVALPFILMQRAQWRPQVHLLVLAGLLGGIANNCFITALMYGEVVRVMLLFYLAPVWGVLGGTLFLGERITAPRAAGMALAVVGAFLVVGGPQALREPPGLADLLGLGSGLFYALTNVAMRAGERIPVASKTLVVFAGCAVVSLALFPVVGTGFPALPPALVLLLLAFAACWLTSAMWTTMYGVTHLEAGRSSVLLVFELVAAVVSAMIIGGERLDGIEWVGAACITTAALIEARASASPQEKPA
ncbi:MAG TPA: DMT family transporter [Ramlibacter sp.]|nr:DMT family transporter [Ramlibacter sp.]